MPKAQEEQKETKIPVNDILSQEYKVKQDDQSVQLNKQVSEKEQNKVLDQSKQSSQDQQKNEDELQPEFDLLGQDKANTSLQQQSSDQQDLKNSIQSKTGQTNVVDKQNVKQPIDVDQKDVDQIQEKLENINLNESGDRASQQDLNEDELQQQLLQQTQYNLKQELKGQLGTNVQDEELQNIVEQIMELNIDKAKLKQEAQPKRKNILKSFDLEGVADYIKQGKAKNIIFMCGAGISVAAGIPDFRSPGSGLYHNLQKYDLPSPEAVFEINFFKRNPQAFYMLSKELAPGNFKPTTAHYFMNVVNNKKLLQRCWTQNIDSLETKAGLPNQKLVACHGNFDSAKCTSCGTEIPIQDVEQCIQKAEVCKCHVCDGYVKPDIVFFGENLPDKFFRLFRSDFNKCDLLIIMGTSLVVHPFAGLVDKVRDSCPRLLINRELVGQGYFPGEGLDFKEESNYRDAYFLGDCDEGVTKLSELLGWKKDLDKMQKIKKTIKQKNRDIEKKISKLYGCLCKNLFTASIIKNSSSKENIRLY